MPEDQAKQDVLLCFFAHLASRVRARRSELRDFCAASRARFDALSHLGEAEFKEQMRIAGDGNRDHAWAAHRALMAQDPNRTWPSRDDLVWIELAVMNMVRNSLSDRRWLVVHANELGLEFATGDDPVLQLGLSEGRLRSLGVEDTDIIVPLSRKTAMIGTLGAKRELRPTDRAFVAAVNGIVMRNADRFVWSARPRLHYDWINGAQLRKPLRAAMDVRRGEDWLRPPGRIAAERARRSMLGR